MSERGTRSPESAEVVQFGQPQVNLEALLDFLGTRGISSVIVEGGATILSAFFRATWWIG